VDYSLFLGQPALYLQGTRERGGFQCWTELSPVGILPGCVIAVGQSLALAAKDLSACRRPAGGDFEPRAGTSYGQSASVENIIRMNFRARRFVARRDGLGAFTGLANFRLGE